MRKGDNMAEQTLLTDGEWINGQIELTRQVEGWDFETDGPAVPCLICNCPHFERIDDLDAWQCEKCGTLVFEGARGNG